eukprot:6173048-Pleurochrysis_carterae.AAC.1
MQQHERQIHLFSTAHTQLPIRLLCGGFSAAFRTLAEAFPWRLTQVQDALLGAQQATSRAYEGVQQLAAVESVGARTRAGSNRSIRPNYLLHASTRAF